MSEPESAALVAPPLSDFRSEDGHLRDCCGCCAGCDCSRLLYARANAMQEWLLRAWPLPEHRPANVAALLEPLTITQVEPDA